jgi:hypothetical protein
VSSDLDPSDLTPDERRAEFTAIPAWGLVRLRDLAALTPGRNSRNPSETSGSGLELRAGKSVPVHAG